MTLDDADGFIKHDSQALDGAHMFRLTHHRPKLAAISRREFFHSVSDVSGTRLSQCGSNYEESLTVGDIPESIEHVSLVLDISHVSHRMHGRLKLAVIYVVFSSLC